MHDIHVCRLCGETSFSASDDMYRYGRRHYAHRACYIERHGLAGLSKLQILAAPFLVLKRLGLLAEVEQLLRGK